MSDQPVKPRQNLLRRLSQLIRTKLSGGFMLFVIVGLFGFLFVLPTPWSSLLLLAFVVMGILLLIADYLNPSRQRRPTLPTATRILSIIERLIVNNPRPIALSAIILIVLAAVWMAPIDDNSNPLHPRIMRGIFALILGGWILHLALIIAPNPDANPRRLPLTNLQLPRFTSTAQVNYWLLGCGAVLLFIVAEASGDLFHIRPIQAMSPHLQFVALVVGIMLVAKGMIGNDNWDWAQFNPMMANVRVRRYEIIGVSLLTVLGLLVRLWQLRVTAQVNVDELNFLPYVLHFWDDPNIELLNPMSSVIPFARIYAYWETWTVAILGRDFAGLRGVSVIMGTLTIPSVWWMTRHIFDRKTALIATVVIATFPPHVHFSRLALNNIGDPLFATLAFGFLARGFQTHKRRDFALAGIALGCVPYFYEAGRLSFPLLTLGFIGFVLLFGYGQFGLRTNTTLRRNLFVFLIVTLLTAFPVYYALINSSANLTGAFAICQLFAGILAVVVER